MSRGNSWPVTFLGSVEGRQGEIEVLDLTLTVLRGKREQA